MPFILLGIGALLAISTYLIGRRYFKDNTLNILSFSAGTGNTGYFGIPLAFMLFDERLANIYVFTVLGSLLYESTIGFFIIAKGKYSVKDSFVRVLRLPAIYAMVLGLVFNIAKVRIPVDLISYLDYFKGAYAVLGMMMIGMGLSGVKKVMLDKLFIYTSLVLKFILFPAVVLAFISIDKNLFNLLNNDNYKVLFLFSIPPMAGNSVAIASLLGGNTEKAAIGVMISTVVSLFTIPFMIAYFMP